MERVRKRAQGNLEKSQEWQKQYYERGSKDWEFQMGNQMLVMLRDHLSKMIA